VKAGDFGVATAKNGYNFSRLSGINSLPAFPAVACKLLGIISDEDASFQEVSRLIMTDTALSSQVLRFANSSLFGFRKEVSSVLRALCLVGANRVRDIVVTLALKNYMGSDDQPLLHACWRHSLSTALWAEALAQWYTLDRPMTYTAGILHDLGRVAMIMLSPDAYALFVNDASSRSSQDFRGQEQDVFELDHCEVGGYLSNAWNFQPALGDVIAHHHEPVTSASPRARVLVQAACMAASMSGFHTVGLPREWNQAALAELLPKTAKGVQPPLDKMRENVLTDLNLIECSLV
jgi:putative nucleotidyltransferase with HDIG domain